MALNRIYGLTVALVFSSIQFNLFPNITANLTVAPLWNVTAHQNVSEECTLEEHCNDGYNLWVFTGKPDSQCSVQVTSVRSGPIIHIPKPMAMKSFMYLENQGNFGKSKYIVVAVNETCSMEDTTWNGNLLIHLEGNGTVVIGDILLNESQSTCKNSSDIVETYLVPNGGEPTRCNLAEYNHAITFSLSNDFTCSFETFPGECVNTIGNRYTESKCPDTNLRSLILYPADITSLYLSRLNIDEIFEHAFVTLNRLVSLDATNNGLSIIHRDAFRGMHVLEILDLRNNKLSTPQPHLLDDLISLSVLKLSGNEVKTLPIDLLQNNLELTYLSLLNNKVHYLPNGLFKYNKKLNYLHLGGNQLTSLDLNLLRDAIGLKTLQFKENMITYLDANLLSETKLLTILRFQDNNVTTLPDNLFKVNTMLTVLTVRGNQLQSIPKQVIGNLTNLRVLSAGQNKLISISYDLFEKLRNLTFIRLGSNLLKTIDEKTFHGLSNLETLFLEFNQITVFHRHTFRDTINLGLLDVSGNMLADIPNINNLKRLMFLGLREMKLTSVDSSTFLDLPNHTEVFVSQTEICECYVPTQFNCTALDVRSPYLTCDRLLSNRALMVMMWIIGLNALCGNILVLSRPTKNERNKVQTYILRNLAMSDLLMGIYMLIIASADSYFGVYFPIVAETWRSGITCRIAGAVSILSSEASVFFVTLISIDRFITVRCPYTRHKINRKSSTRIVAIIWAISFTLAIVPSVLAGGNFKFYDMSHVCVGLPLAQIERFTKEVSIKWVQYSFGRYDTFVVKSQSLGRVSGLYYATAVFLGLNGLCYFTILLCYLEIVRYAYMASKRSGLKNDKKQITMTIKVAAIVLTDFFCWAPVIVLGILVQAGVLTLPPSVFAWMVTVILPINSAINPYLYTIVDLIGKRRLDLSSRLTSSKTNDRTADFKSTASQLNTASNVTKSNI